MIQEEGDDKAISVKDAPLFKAGWNGFGFILFKSSYQEWLIVPLTIVDRLFIMNDLAAVEEAIGKGAKNILYWK